MQNQGPAKRRIGMLFMMLVKANRDFEAGASMNPKLEAAVTKFLDEATARGMMVAASRLMPSSVGARVRGSSGKITVIDGPFVETKELVAGYVIFEAESKGEVVDCCRQLMQLHLDILGPSYDGEFEIRPVFETYADSAGTKLKRPFATPQNPHS